MDNELVPNEWTKEDMIRASQEMTDFSDTRAYAWIVNWLRVNRDRSRNDLSDKDPMNTTHEYYIKTYERRRVCDDIMSAITYLVSVKGE